MMVPMVDSRKDPLSLAAKLKGHKVRPVHLWNPPYCGDSDMRIGRDGTWYYRNSPIGRPAMVELFASVLRHDDDGYYLVTPVEKLGIAVEDAPFLAVEMTVTGQGRAQILTFRTNTQDWVEADRSHPLRFQIDSVRAEPAPYILVRDRLEAKINRPVFYDLVALAVEEEQDGTLWSGVWSAGQFFPIDQAPK